MSKLLQGISVLALAAASIYGQTAIRPLKGTVTSAMVGIAEGQTAQLNALNAGVASPAATGIICSGVLSFIDDTGTVLKSATVSVAPGTSQSISLDSAKDLALATAERKEIRATITIPPASTIPPPSTSTTPTLACRLIGTLEIFNTLDGHTQVTLGTVHLLPEPVATPGT
jgi:hypothetical protein